MSEEQQESKKNNHGLEVHNSQFRSPKGDHVSCEERGNSYGHAFRLSPCHTLAT